MHITLFGGAFDPPHLGHIKVVQNFLKENLTQKVVFLPVKEHNFSKEMRDAALRLRMLELVVEKNFVDLPVEVSDFELKQTGVSYSFATLEQLSSLNPGTKFSFLIGSDNLRGFPKWDNYQDLLAKYQVFVYPRAGFDFTGLLPGMVALESLPQMKVSSELVKENLHNRKMVENLLTPEVGEYITKNHLYLDSHVHIV
jgi:nicotinate-nucleotide adenylyltransferase